MMKKNKILKSIIAMALSVILIMPSVAFADEVPNAAESEIVEIDDENPSEEIIVDETTDTEESSKADDLEQAEDNRNEAEEDITNEDNNNPEETEDIDEEEPIEEEPIEDDEELEADEDEMLSPDGEARAVSYPATGLYFFNIRGYSNGEEKTETIICGQNYSIDSNVSATAKTHFDRNKPVRIGVYFEGYQFVSQRPTASGDTYLTNEAPYDIKIDKNGAAKEYRKDYIIYQRDPDAKQTVFEFRYCPYMADGTNFYDSTYSRKLTFYWNDGNKTEEPITPIRTFDEATPDHYVITGVDSTMEYRKGSNTEWTDCPDGNLLVDIPENTEVLYVRFKATDGEPSKSREISLPARKTANVNYDLKQQEVTVTADMEYSIDNGPYYDVPMSMVNDGDISSIIDAVPAGGTSVLKIRYKQTDTEPYGKDYEITLYPRAAQPADLSFDYTTYILTFKSKTLQYKIIAGDNETVWQNHIYSPIKFADMIYDDMDTTILVRERAIANTCSASIPVTYVVPKKVAGCENAELDLVSECIVGLEAGKSYEYRIGTSTTRSSFTSKDGTFSIKNLIKTSHVKLYLREKATGTIPPTTEKLIELPTRRSNPPKVTITYNKPGYVDKAYITGMTDDMQYSVKDTNSWQNGTGKDIVMELPTSNTTMYVKAKATDTNFASANISYTLLAHGSAPVLSFNALSETIGTTKTTMEVDFGNGYTDVTGNKIDMSSFIDGLTTQAQVRVRYKATETKPTSDYRYFTMNPRGEMPTGITFNEETLIIYGVSNSTDYKIGDNGAWKSISSGKSFNVSKYASTASDVNVYIRKSATSKFAASKPLVFVIPKKQA